MNCADHTTVLAPAHELLSTDLFTEEWIARHRLDAPNLRGIRCWIIVQPKVIHHALQEAGCCVNKLPNGHLSQPGELVRTWQVLLLQPACVRGVSAAAVSESAANSVRSASPPSLLNAPRVSGLHTCLCGVVTV